MEPLTARKYSRIARLYDLVESPMERIWFARMRKEAVSHAKGETLEVGVGTGKNIPCYDTDVCLSAIDFSPGMLDIALKKYGRYPLKQLEFHLMDVEALAFPDNSFDSVVSTFVFCTVPHPRQGLQELHRVLRPGGKAIFLEHMRSEKWWINALLYVMNLFSTSLLGTSMLRKTQQSIEAAGFQIERRENRLFDVVRLIIARKA